MKNKGFTLIELLVVIGILAILLAVTLIAINPARQFQQARDTQRRSDVNSVLNAINQYSIDNEGALPGDNLGPGGSDLITSSSRLISTTEANICANLIPLYIAALPIDPELATGSQKIVSNCAIAGGYDTGYTVRRTASDRVVVSAPETEVPPIIEVMR